MLEQVSRLSNAESRSISPENPTGARGAGGMSTDGLAAAFAGLEAKLAGISKPRTVETAAE